MSNTQLIIYGAICVVGSIPFYVSLFTANNHNGDPQLAEKKTNTYHRHGTVNPVRIRDLRRSLFIESVTTGT